MVAPTRIDTRPVEGFAATLAAHDFDALVNVLHPEIRFRALTPNHTFGLFGAASAIAALTDWFGDKSPLELVSSEVDFVGDRVRLAYRFRALADNVWTLIEQQAYCAIEAGLITDISIVCTGYRPE